MLWILIEALIALALLVGAVVWVIAPTQKRDIKNHIAPAKPPPKEERKNDGF